MLKIKRKKEKREEGRERKKETKEGRKGERKSEIQYDFPVLLGFRGPGIEKHQFESEDSDYLLRGAYLFSVSK